MIQSAQVYMYNCNSSNFITIHCEAFISPDFYYVNNLNPTDNYMRHMLDHPENCISSRECI